MNASFEQTAVIRGTLRQCRKPKETRTDRILERYFSTVDTGFFDQSYAICIECLHV